MGHARRKSVTDCPFCQPPRARIINANEDWVSVLSDPKLVEGHALVIPRRHVVQLSELSIDELAKGLEEVRRLVEEVMRHGYGAGYEIRIKSEPWEPDGDVHVSHLHIHVVPRNPGDGLFGATETGRQTGAFTPLLQPDDVLSDLMPDWRKNRRWY